jgi:hypothetical protein
MILPCFRSFRLIVDTTKRSNELECIFKERISSLNRYKSIFIFIYPTERKTQFFMAERTSRRIEHICVQEYRALKRVSKRAKRVLAVFSS